MAMMGKIRSMHFRQGKSISEIARLTSWASGSTPDTAIRAAPAMAEC